MCDLPQETLDGVYINLDPNEDYVITHLLCAKVIRSYVT